MSIYNESLHRIKAIALLIVIPEYGYVCACLVCDAMNSTEISCVKSFGHALCIETCFSQNFNSSIMWIIHIVRFSQSILFVCFSFHSSFVQFILTTHAPDQVKLSLSCCLYYLTRKRTKIKKIYFKIHFICVVHETKLEIWQMLVVLRTNTLRIVACNTFHLSFNLTLKCGK